MNNERIIDFSRAEIIKGLNKCTVDQISIFKRTYSSNDLLKPINEIVNNMPVDKLDWALSQIDNTVEKND